MSNTNDHPATWNQIVRHFLDMDYRDMTQGNWGTARDNSVWNVNSETYINGILLTLDHDYEMAWLIEIVDRTESTVSYGIIVTWPKPEVAGRDHDSLMYEGVVGTFFDRKITDEEVCEWALPKMYGLLENKGAWG